MAIRARCINWAKEYLPEVVLASLARGRARHNGLAANTRSMVEQFGLADKVVSGPFRGMKYLGESTGSLLLPKLLGTYEAELHSIIEQELSSPPRLMIDVGAAEGYYAVGFAFRSPTTRVINFDTYGYARYLQRKLSAMNNVGARMSIRKRCDPAELNRALQTEADALVVCDCEGYETTLLDPGRAPFLSRSRILVEMHDVLFPGITPLIVQRFAPTHHITQIDAVERTLNDFPSSVQGPDPLKLSAMREYRPPGMTWLYMRPLEERAMGADK